MIKRGKYDPKIPTLDLGEERMIKPLEDKSKDKPEEPESGNRDVKISYNEE